MSHIVLIPAYGRDYKGKAAIVKDLHEGKEFIAYSYDGSSGYTTAAELIALGKFNVNVRYNQQRSVAVVDLRKLAVEVAKADKPKKPRKAKKADFDSLEEELEAIMPELKS